MASSLPAEVVALILDRADELQGAPARQLNRNTFRLVSKAWLAGVNRWREMYLEGGQVKGVLAALAASPGLCSAVQRLTFRTHSKEKRSASEARVVKLLKLCSNLDELTLLIDHSGELKSVEPALASALATLVRMKHFTLYTRAKRGKRAGGITTKLLSTFVSRWPRLESFALSGTWVTPPYRTQPVWADLFASNTSLNSLSLNLGERVDDGMHSFLTAIPASVTSLSLNVDFFDQRQTCAQQFAQQLAVLAPQLAELALGCRTEPRCAQGREIPRDARLDATVANLTAVRRLTLPSFAVGRWVESYEPLKDLEELTLEEVGDRYVPWIGSDELSAVVRGAAKVAKVRVASRVCEAWTEEERAAFEVTVREKNVALEVVFSLRNILGYSSSPLPNSHSSFHPEMTLPDLAVELQLHILAFALEDESSDPFEGRTHRNNLRRVCKAYDQEILSKNKVKEVSFTVDEAGAVLTELSRVDSLGQPLADSIARVFIKTPNNANADMGELIRNTSAVIASCVNATEVGLDVIDNVNFPAAWYFFGALRQLNKLKHVAIYADAPSDKSRNTPASPEYLSIGWPSLESFTIKQIRRNNETAVPFSTSVDVSSSPTHLSFKLHYFYFPNLAGFLANLSPSVSAFELDVDIFHFASKFAPDVRAQIARLAGKFKEVSLINQFRSLPSLKAFLIRRGKRIDDLVSRFVSGTKLTIATSAVTHWAPTLEPLVNLETLTIVESETGYLGDLAAGDLLLVLPRLVKLKALGLSAIAWARWSPIEQTAFKDTTTNLGITFSIC